MEPAQTALDKILTNTDVRLRFKEVDHIIMGLKGCDTMVDSIGEIKLYLLEELLSEQISYVGITREFDQ